MSFENFSFEQKAIKACVIRLANSHGSAMSLTIFWVFGKNPSEMK